MQWVRILRKTRLIFLTAVLIAAPDAAEADDQEKIEKGEAQNLHIVELAMTGKFAELEAKVAERKALVDAHPEQDVGFSDLFDPFGRADPKLAGPLKEWREKYPNSFAPYMAFGAYSTHLGWVARGEYNVGLTNAKRFGEMRRYFDEAVSALRTAIRLYPKVPNAWRQLIGIASTQVGVAEVDGLFEEAVRHVPRSSTLYRTYYDVLASKWGGSDSRQHDLKIRIQGKFADNPDFGWIETVEDNDKAWALYWDNQVEPALALFETIIAQRPDFYSRHGRAMTLISLGRSGDAIREFHRILALDPGNSKIYSELALAQRLNQEPHGAAMRSISRALLFDPFNPEYLSRRARMYMDRQESEAAKRDLDRALLLGAYNDQVRNRLRLYYWQVGDMAHAVEEAGKMLTLAPARTENWFLYAITLQEGRDCRALPAFETYLQQCLIKKECNEMKQQVVTHEIYKMKQACS